MSGFAYRIAHDHAEKVDIRDALAPGAELVWVHLSTNTERAQIWLRERAGLDDYVVDALTAQETRPRCDAIGEGALINLRGRAAEGRKGGDLLASLRVWAVKGRVLSVSRVPLIALDEVGREVEQGHVDDPGDLITAFATAITNDLDPDVAELGDDLDTCEEALDTRRVFELRRKVAHVRVAAIGYRRFMAPQRAALEKLATLPGDWLADDDRLHIDAAADRAARMAEELESIRERAALMHETLSDLRAEQIDTRSLIVSVAALVFLPVTFITGLYGMNVDELPFAHRPWAFDAILGLCALVAVAVVAFFGGRHWFRSG